MRDNIVLIGLPGAGKSTLGVILAKMANYRFLDCDLVIQEYCGQTLQEIIDEQGAAAFLQLEQQVLSSLDATRTVISTGGSAVYSDKAMEHLRSLGTIIHIKVSCDEMIHRIGELDGRGVVLAGGAASGETDLRTLYDERMPLYERYADVTLEVGDASVRDSALELKGIIEGRGLLATGGQGAQTKTLRSWRSADRSYCMERQVSFNMLDCHRHLKPSEALRLFQDAANADFSEFGFTHANMIEQGFYFIITHANCRVLRQPRDEERVCVRTWPHKIKGMQISRCFELTDEQEATIACCEMVYLIVDAAAGHPIRIKDFPLMEMYGIAREVELSKRQRIKLDDAMVQVGSVRPRFSDLDVNGHVNNTNYASFGFDALPAELQQRAWSEFQVEFAAELHAGEDALVFANDALAAAAAGEWVKVVGAQEDGTSNFGCLFRF